MSAIIPQPIGGEMAPRKMTKEEKEWQAESDAHTLATAEEIALDKSRLAAAKKKATDMAQAAVKTANRYVRVAKTPAAKKAAPKAKPSPKAKPKPSPKKAAAKRPAAKRSPRGRK